MSKAINTNKKAKKSARPWLPWVIILIAFAGLVIFHSCLQRKTAKRARFSKGRDIAIYWFSRTNYSND
ncbi:MAG: hypothetical protein IPJ74_25490 [Saprospiraceae bacterium]|nr:hypothetical protein [Saprospiraceae bacterium]